MNKILLLSLTLLCARVSEVYSQVLGNPLYNWDFASGIPANWQNGSASGIGLWEYRGPNTTPDITIGARGSCAAIAQPIASQTQSNGFVIFDSNYWDDIDMDCGGLGSGVDPAPHNAWLITNPINLSSTVGSVLTFQHQFRNYQATMKVQISTNGGVNWTDILTVAGFESSAVEWQSVNISALASGQSNVQFKFLFTGTYYWWLLDDITVYEPNQNDVALSSVKYTTNTGANNNDLEYDQYPLVMIPAFNFKATCSNIGALTQTNVRLNTRIVRDSSTQTYNQTTAGISLTPGQSNTFTIAPAYTNPATLGDYKIYYDILQNQTDDNPANNKDSLDYTISTYTYARDEGPMENAFGPSGSYLGYNYEAGNFFQARNTGRVCRSLGVAVAEGTQVGAQIKGIVYAADMETVLAETAPHTINVAELNAIGQEKIIHLPLLTPITLTNNVQYLVMVSTINANETVKIARSGISVEESSILRYPDINASFYFLTTPVVRMKIFTATDVPGCMNNSASNYSPTATIDDGSCIFIGCSNPLADNYNVLVNFDDGSCVIGGCLDEAASNYNPSANYDNGSCIYPGCTDENATNFDPQANQDDGSCIYVNAQLSFNVIDGCAPLTVTVSNLTAVAEGGTCHIEFGNGESQDVCFTDLNVVYSEPGTYLLEYTYSLDGFSSVFTQEIEVYATPVTPVLTYSSANHEITCSGCDYPSVEWYMGTTLLASGVSEIDIIQNGIPQNGEYSVTVRNEFGCFGYSLPLLVVEPAFSVSDDTGCSPLSVEVLDQTDAIDGLELSIDWGDGSPAAGFIGFAAHNYNSPGIYIITVYAQAGDAFGTATRQIIVEGAVLPELSVSGGSVVCANCDEFASVTWDINGEEFTGTGPFDAEPGLYIVSGTTAAGCVGEDQILVTGIFGVSGQAFVSVYPNPADVSLNLVSLGNPISRIRIFDGYGRIVLIKESVNSINMILDVTGMVSGLYLLEIETTEGKQTTRLTVNH